MIRTSFTRDLTASFAMFPKLKTWFSYAGKIPDDRGFYFLPTIQDFADISDIRQRPAPDFRLWIWREMESAPNIETWTQM